MNTQENSGNDDIYHVALTSQLSLIIRAVQSVA